MKRIFLLIIIVSMYSCAGLQTQPTQVTTEQQSISIPAFGLGRNLISSIQVNGQTYNLIAFYSNDPVDQFWMQFIQGDWQAPMPVILWIGCGIESGQNVKDEATARAFVQKGMDDLNTFLTKQFGNTLPTTWQQFLTKYMRLVILRMVDGIPQAIPQ